MPDTPTLEELAREVRYLRDRQEILDCVNLYSRGLDRLDEHALMTSYHQDAIDRHGPFYGKRDEFVKWALELEAGFIATHHNITTHNCEIDGDTAYAESYCLFLVVQPDGKSIGTGAARYIDQLERRDGKWAVVSRCVLMHSGAEFERSSWLGDVWEELPEKRDPSDLSYQRPLRFPEPGQPRPTSGDR